MAKFLDSKERVYDLQLTSYGKYLLSVGKFKPHTYAFFDDNVLYDGAYASIDELQNSIHGRIKDETPYLESLVLFEEVETPSEIRQDPAMHSFGGFTAFNRLSLAAKWFGEMGDYVDSYKVLGYGYGTGREEEGYYDADAHAILTRTAAGTAPGVTTYKDTTTGEYVGYPGGPEALAALGITDYAAYFESLVASDDSDPGSRLDYRVLAEGPISEHELDGLESAATAVPIVNFFHGDVFPTEYLPRKDIFKIEQSIGDAKLSALETNVAPAWKVVVLNGRIKYFNETRAYMQLVFWPWDTLHATNNQEFTLTDGNGTSQVFIFRTASDFTGTYHGLNGDGKAVIPLGGITDSQGYVNSIANAITGQYLAGGAQIIVTDARTITTGEPVVEWPLLLLSQMTPGLAGNIDHAAALSGITGLYDYGQPFSTAFYGGHEHKLDVTEKDLSFPSGSSGIPQVNIEVDYQKNAYSTESLSLQYDNMGETKNRSGIFLDDKYVQLDTQTPMVYVDEVNTEILNKNFDMEVFLVTGSADNIGYNKNGVWGYIEPTYQLIRKYFTGRKDQIVDGKMTTNHPYDNKESEVDTTSVEYYFNVIKDSDANKEIVCKGIQEYNKSSYYIDLDLDCESEGKENIYNDIYGSEVEPELCLD